MMHEYQVCVHDWVTVKDQSPKGAATKRSRQLGLERGSSILVKDKNGHVRQFIVGRAPQIVHPKGRQDVPR